MAKVVGEPVTEGGADDGHAGLEDTEHDAHFEAAPCGHA